MNETTVRAYAKVNLTLEIVGRENGYHQLDSLVASVDVYDSIRLKKRKGRLSSKRTTRLRRRRSIRKPSARTARILLCIRISLSAQVWVVLLRT